MSLNESSSWSKHSGSYNGPSGQALTLPMVQSAFDASWFGKLDRSIRECGSRPVRVLCLACGTGAEVQVMCNRYTEEQMTILATDFAPGMVDATQAYVDRAHKNAMVQTRVMDAMHIEADDCSFDVVTLVLGPMLMPEPSKVFQEIRRVLVPGGWSAYLTPNHMETHDVMTKVKREVLEGAKRLDKYKNFYDSDIMKNWGTADLLRAKLEPEGFEEVESIEVHSVLTLQRGQEIDLMLDRLFENPGMLQLYTKDLSESETGHFKASVRANFHANWPSTKAPLPAAPYVIANAASARRPEK